jgi:aspartyl-tRNA(Asn)/glutamyl-tRNA(Gln) amidotransferase subunit A
MTDTELKKLTLVDTAQMIAQRKISAREMADAVISRIEHLNPDFRAFITVMHPANSDDPRSPDGKAHSLHKTGLLAGVPISVKDLYDTKGIRTTAGSKVFAERIPREDATVVAKLKDAGAVIVGKNNLHEFAFGVTTVNPHYGIARNPWDRECISGGSSGGSASAVALSMGFGSMGSDTGGSIRIPASLCGIVGLKPTYGRVSLRGIVPLSWSLDHAGPMTRTVQDAAVLMDVIAGYDSRDPYSRNVDRPRYTDALTGGIKGVRVGIPDKFFYEHLAPPVETAIHAAIRTLEKLGAEIIRIDVPGVAIHRATWLQIASPEAYSYHEVHLRNKATLYGADVRGRLEAGRALLSIDYVRAQRARTLIKEQCRQLFDTVDVIVTPTVPIPAPRICDLDKPWGNGPETSVASLTRFTRFFSVVGLPSISIPCGFTPEGLPVGMQIAGKAFDEFTVLRVAHAYEQDARWFERRPTI